MPSLRCYARTWRISPTSLVLLAPVDLSVRACLGCGALFILQNDVRHGRVVASTAVSLSIALHVIQAMLWVVIAAIACCGSGVLDTHRCGRKHVIPLAITCSLVLHIIEGVLVIGGAYMLIAWTQTTRWDESVDLVAAALLTTASAVRLAAVGAIALRISARQFGGKEWTVERRAADMSDLIRSLFCLVAPGKNCAASARLLCFPCCACCPPFACSNGRGRLMATRSTESSGGFRTSSGSSNYDELFSILGSTLEQFWGGSDLVESDLVLGALLLYGKQRAGLAREHFRLLAMYEGEDEDEAAVWAHPQAAIRGAAVITPPSETATPRGEEDDAAAAAARDVTTTAAALEAARYFSKYATAMYGWLLHTYMHGACGGGGGNFRATPQTQHATNGNGSDPVVDNEPAPHRDTAALMRVLTRFDEEAKEKEKEMENADASAGTFPTPSCALVYADWKVEAAARVPIAVVLDLHSKTVVIACRGTFTMRDTLSDTIAKDVQVRVLQDDSRAHVPIV